MCGLYGHLTVAVRRSGSLLNALFLFIKVTKMAEFLDAYLFIYLLESFDLRMSLGQIRA